MRTKEKAYAKINLALYVGKREDGFHPIDSVVASVDLYDDVTVATRYDDKINLKPSGLREYIYGFGYDNDNAYKAAALFKEKYNTKGVDIYIRKAIPLSGGMGGSSADAAAVLRAMAKLYKVDDDLSPLAAQLGSDTPYMLSGGFARLGGRGEIITPIDCFRRLHIVAVYPDSGVNTSACFEEFDELELPTTDGSMIDGLVHFLSSEDDDYAAGLSGCINDLYPAACSVNPDVKDAFEAIKSLSPSVAFMTGSGSTVCGIYPEEMLARWAVDKLKKSGFSADYLYTVKETKKKKDDRYSR